MPTIDPPPAPGLPPPNPCRGLQLQQAAPHVYMTPWVSELSEAGPLPDRSAPGKRSPVDSKMEGPGGYVLPVSATLFFLPRHQVISMCV